MQHHFTYATSFQRQLNFEGENRKMYSNFSQYRSQSHPRILHR